MADKQFHLAIPEGTKVLIKSAGRVGVVSHTSASPEHSYRVRFADGPAETFKRSDLTIFKQVQAEIPGALDSEACCASFITVASSVRRLTGLNQDGSDIDRRGFYLPPADLEWSLARIPEQIKKFILLALKANPNVLECLYTPLIEDCSPIGHELLEIRSAFLSKYIHRTYNAYVLSQFKKIEQDLRSGGQIRWKHVMHLIRLLISGVGVLRDRLVTLRVDEHRQNLLAIRRGDVVWEEVEQWRLSLHAELDCALGSTSLPEHPDYGCANEFLIKARRFAAAPEYAR